MAPLPKRTTIRYAASFRAGFSSPAVGALVVEEAGMRLEGRSDQGRVEFSIPFSEVSEVRIGRLPEERLNERSALLLSRADGDLVRVAPMEFGLLNQLADLLTTLADKYADPHEQVVIVLPLRKGRLSRAKELVAQGPPFDPAIIGLTRHEVFLTDREAIFVFEGRNVRKKFERLTRDPTLWQAGLAWRSCVDGRPRISGDTVLPSQQPFFSWTSGVQASGGASSPSAR